MIYVEKDNRQYCITEDEKQKFIDAGYRVGKLVDKKLVFEEVETKETKEIKNLKAKVEKLEKDLEKAKKEGK